MKKECVAMLLAGGQGSRLYVLTGDMAKPAVPFGGKFRIIDFPLSNCTNSGIDTVGVLTQYRPLELNSYIGSGQPWELDRLNGGVHILPPYQSASGASWYKGTANAIYQNIGFVDLYDPEYVAVLSGDHIYKMDYSRMLQHHKDAGAACTISEPLDLVIERIPGRNDDHAGRFSLPPELFEYPQAAAVGQHDVQQNTVVIVSGDLFERRCVIGRLLDHILFAAQRLHHDLPQGGFVFHDQDFHKQQYSSGQS